MVVSNSSVVQSVGFCSLKLEKRGIYDSMLFKNVKVGNIWFHLEIISPWQHAFSILHCERFYADYSAH